MSPRLPGPLPEEFVLPAIAGAAIMLFLVWLVFNRASFSIDKKRGFAVSLVIGIVLVGWFVGAALAAQAGIFKGLTIVFPNMGIIFVPIILGVLLASMHPAFRKLIESLPQHWLISVQASRLMGSQFLVFYSLGLMPAEFAIPAGIGDIVVGAAAPFVGYIYYLGKSYSKKVAIAWNIIGVVELSISIILGFLTSSTPYQLLALSNPNELLFAFPLVLIPAFAVPLSLLLHFFSLSVLLKKGRSAKAFI